MKFFIGLTRLGCKETYSKYVNRKIVISNLLYLFVSSIIFSYGVYVFFAQDVAVGRTLMITGIVVGIIGLLFNKLGWVTASRLLYVGLCTFIIFRDFYNFNLGIIEEWATRGFTNPNLHKFYLITTTTIAISLFDYREEKVQFYITTIFSVLSFLFFEEIQMLLGLPLNDYDYSFSASFFRTALTANILFVIGIIMILLIYNDKIQTQLENKQEEIEDQNVALENKNSELNKTMDDLKNAQTHLVQSEKMASMSVLIKGMVNEFTQPMDRIYQGLEKLNSLVPNAPEEAKDGISYIQTGLSTTMNAIDKLSLFGQKSDMKSDFAVQDVLQDAVDAVRLIFGSRIEFVSDFVEEKCELTGKSQKLYTAFMNILLNACESIDRFGIVDIALRKSGDYYVIQVKDSGKGIEEGTLKQITDPFFSTKEGNENKGLGLSISLSVIEEHNGKLEINSSANQGTLVSIYLPVA